eukprot:SAG11_NODE_4105_length_2063_cov_1.399185_4_plen_79_part_00
MVVRALKPPHAGAGVVDDATITFATLNTVPECRYATFVELYQSAFYWAITTLSTVGFGGEAPPSPPPRAAAAVGATWW